MAQFSLGIHDFSTSPERDKFAKLRQRYLTLGLKCRKNFNAQYESFKTADDMFENLHICLNNILSDTTAMVAQDLVENRIFEISEKSIHAELELRAEAVADRFNRIQDQYFEIIGKAAELEAQRREARENRGGVVGGGFGLEGAARGIALAAVANAAIGLTHGLADATAKAASNLGDKKKKQKLLVDPATKRDAGDFYVRIALQGAELVAAKVNTAAEATRYESVPNESAEKSAAILENITAGRVPDGDVQPILVQSLRLNPFNEAAWRSWLDRFGDADASASTITDRLGVGAVKAHKAKMIANRKALLSWGTPEECRANSAILEQYAEWLGFSFDEEKASIEERALKLDRERRTFNSVEYTSLAEAEAARQTYNDQVEAARKVHEDEARRTVDGIVYDTHESADAVRAEIRDNALARSRSGSAIGWLALGYRRILDVKGRSGLTEFWVFLAVFITITAECIFMQDYIPKEFIPFASFLFIIYVIYSALTLTTLQIRRFHDQDYSGWMILLNIIPYVGWFIVLIFMAIDGSKFDNKYGPSLKSA